MINLFIIIVRCIFLLLIPYHLYQKQYKKSKSAAIVLILSFVPNLLRLFDVWITPLTIFLYFLILCMALYLGSSFKFYDKYVFWDRLLHFLCGLTFFYFGISIAQKVIVSGTFGILLFSVMFSVTVSVLWEIGEFTSDSISHGDAQRWQRVNASRNHQPPDVIQPAGLVDTMSDLIFGLAGALLACVIKAIVFYI